MNILLVSSAEPDQTPRSAASDLALHCLKISHKMYARLICLFIPYFRRGQCPSSLGTIHHFRSCRKEWNGKKNRTNCMELQRFTDPIVANVMAKVESKALALKNKLFPTDVIA